MLIQRETSRVDDIGNSGGVSRRIASNLPFRPLSRALNHCFFSDIDQRRLHAGDEDFTTTNASGLKEKWTLLRARYLLVFEGFRRIVEK